MNFDTQLIYFMYCFILVPPKLYKGIQKNLLLYITWRLHLFLFLHQNRYYPTQYTLCCMESVSLERNPINQSMADMNIIHNLRSRAHLTFSMK